MPPSHGGLSFIWLFTLRTNEFRASPYHHLTYVFSVRPSASELACRSLNQNLTYVFPVRAFESQLSCRSLNQNLPYVFPVRTSASQLSCRSLNQNLPSILNVDSLLGSLVQVTEVRSLWFLRMHSPD